MGIDVDELRKMLKERKEVDIFSRMEYRKPPGKSRIRREIRTPEGELVYVEEREVIINPYTGQQEQKITIVSQKCEVCGMPITGEMLAMDQIKPCIICGRKTCPRCRVNTDVVEYLKPEVRGQPLCQECWNTLASQLIITCPTCGKPARNYSEIKKCAICGIDVCQSCGVPLSGGLMLCSRCAMDYQERLRREETIRARADQLFHEALRSVM